MPEYREIKQAIEPKIDSLLNEQLAFNSVETEYRQYLKKGITAVQNLGLLFDKLDVIGRQQLIRSSLKQNAVFSDGRVRTPELNSLILLITYADAAHSHPKTEKGSQNGSLSCMVPQTGLEPVRPRRHRILSPACLPIPPPGHLLRCVLSNSYRNHTGIWIKKISPTGLIFERKTGLEPATLTLARLRSTN